MEFIAFMVLVVVIVTFGRIVYSELRLYKLRLEYVQLRVNKLKTEYTMRRDLEEECIGEDFHLLRCQCERCEFGDDTSIGVVCCLDKAQFTENGNCSDFVEK